MKLFSRSALNYSSDPAVQAEIMSWLFLQVTSLGPNVWQYLNWEHRPEMQQARPVFHSEILRLLGVFNERLSRPGTNGWVTDHGFSIADIVWAPIVEGWKQKRCGFSLKDFPAIEKWSDQVYARPAVKRAYETGGLFFGERPGYPKS
jgi:GSH-dependent disulfide-bond oxidoreductase